jgi:hypothetical protein
MQRFFKWKYLVYVCTRTNGRKSYSELAQHDEQREDVEMQDMNRQVEEQHALVERTNQQDPITPQR